MRHFVCFYSLNMVSIYYNLQKKKPYLLFHRDFDHILNMQKCVTHNFVSTFHGHKMDVRFNLALFIFRCQRLRRFSEKKKYKTGILSMFTFYLFVLHYRWSIFTNLLIKEGALFMFSGRIDLTAKDNDFIWLINI